MDQNHVILTQEQRQRIEDFRARHKTGVLTLLFTDMVGSTDIKRELGDAGGTLQIELQQQIIREVLSQFAEAEEIMTAGDSFFITFIRPSDAVKFSLMVNARLRELNTTLPRPILIRIGIHMGEVFIDTSQTAGKKRDVLGIQVDAASRVMLLAVGEQILMTRAVFDNARAVLRGMEIDGLRHLSWLNHGYYKAQGVEEPFEICEVGEEGMAPLSPPPNSNKAQRYIIPDLEPVLGWHPGLELEIPTAPGWVLAEKVGEGGFGEVWRAHHRTLKDDRLFKFCFHQDRVRSLKREVTLFRLLREKIGDHPNIVRIHDVYFDQPPYYIEMEYFQAKDLGKYCQLHGGPDNIPMATRVEIILQTAEALAVAHEAGVLHRDIKPSNILVSGPPNQPDKIQVKLTDFGIGQVMLDQISSQVTLLGMTDILSRTEMSSRSGTRLYMAPEILAGRPSSIQSDIYSLGVVLYQLALGDLTEPVTTDWREKITDPVVAEDIARCFVGKPENRFASARIMAESLRQIPARREKYLQELRNRQAAEEAASRLAEYEVRQSRRKLYTSTIRLASRCVEENKFSEARDLLISCPAELRHWEWGRLQYLCHQDRLTLDGHQAPITCLAVSADGGLLAAGGADRVVTVWRRDTGEEVLRLEDHSERIDSLLFGMDGATLITATASGMVKVWELADGKERYHLVGHKNVVDSMVLSVDGRLLATGSWDKTARIWDLTRGTEVTFLESRAPLVVGFEREGRCLALGTWDQKATILDVQSGKPVSVLKGRFPLAGPPCVVFSPDATRLATGGKDGVVHVWDVLSGLEVGSYKGHLGAISSLSFHPAGKLLASGSTDQTLRVWDLKTSQEPTIYRGHSDNVSAVLFLPNTNEVMSGSFDRMVKVWDLAGTFELKRLQGHQSNVWSVAFSPDGRYLASASGEASWGENMDNTIRIWDLLDATEIQILQGHDSNVWSLGWNPEFPLLASASADCSIRVWELPSGQLRNHFKAHEGQVMVVSFSPDGKLLASGGRDNTIRIWDVQTGEEVYRLKRHTGAVSALAFHPEGKVLASGSWDNTLRIWCLERGQEQQTLVGHTGTITSLAYNPAGNFLASGSKDFSVRLWETGSYQQENLLVAEPTSVNSVAFSPDGKRLLVACSDNTARIWDVEHGDLLLSLKGHTWFVMTAAFSPDGKRIATGSSDHSILLWETFPWKEHQLPGDKSIPLARRMERYKRQYWKRLAAKIQEKEAAEETLLQEVR